MRTEAELQAVVAALNYDFTDFTLDHFITQVEADRQRTLFIADYDFEPDLHGAWLPAVTADYLFVSRSAHPIHRNHIILHEIAHMLLNHRAHDLSAVLGAELSALLGLSDRWGHLRSTRSAEADPEQEQEAEQFVLLLSGNSSPCGSATMSE